MKRLLLFLFCLGLAGSLQAGTLGKGSAEIFEGNEGAARDQAKQNALRDAVEQGVGAVGRGRGGDPAGTGLGDHRNGLRVLRESSVAIPQGLRLLAGRA